MSRIVAVRPATVTVLDMDIFSASAARTPEGGNDQPRRHPSSKVRPVRDSDVREGLVAAVAAKLGEQPHVLVPEVDIRWTVPARMDAMLIADRIAGFEIKSDVDSLARLPRQVTAYGAVVERAHLVVGERHRDAAVDLVPDWWSVWSARWQGDRVAVRQVRRGRLNPAIDPLAVTSLLSRSDLEAALRAAGERQLSSKSVDDLRLLLVWRLGAAKTLRVARSALLARPDLRHRSLTNR